MCLTVAALLGLEKEVISMVLVMEEVAVVIQTIISHMRMMLLKLLEILSMSIVRNRVLS